MFWRLIDGAPYAGVIDEITFLGKIFFLGMSELFHFM